MRCLSRRAFDAATPLSRGWGVEVGLTIDVLLSGMQVLEVPCRHHHRVSGSDWRGQPHRAPVPRRRPRPGLPPTAPCHGLRRDAATAAPVASQGTAPRRYDVLRRVLLTGSFGIFLAIGLLGPSAAKPRSARVAGPPAALFAPSSAGTTGLLAAAYLLGLAAVALALLRPPTRSWSWRGTLLLAAGALLTGPFGSADHTNYAAYGRIAGRAATPTSCPRRTGPRDWTRSPPPLSRRGPRRSASTDRSPRCCTC